VDTPTPHPRALFEDMGELPESFRAAHPQIGRLELAMVGAGGALGALGAIARLLVEDVVSSRLPLAFPVGTLAVNLSGTFLLGLLAGLALTGDALVLAGGATLGSYTTFSTWMLETHSLAEDGRWTAAAANVLVSIAMGLGAVILGRTLGGWL
jgi:fluoride exporter